MHLDNQEAHRQQRITNVSVEESRPSKSSVQKVAQSPKKRPAPKIPSSAVSDVNNDVGRKEDEGRYENRHHTDISSLTNFFHYTQSAT